jgi:uncharacterized membrane protein YbaN (DUF454 family)
MMLPKQPGSQHAGIDHGGPVISCARGAVRVRDKDVFGSSRHEACRRFVRRVFRLNDVRSVEVDCRKATATVRYVGKIGAAELLAKMADTLGTEETGTFDESLERLFEWHRGERFKVFRCGPTDTTWDRSDSVLVVSGARRGVYLGLAAASFGLAATGVVIPGVPTVPFLLVTSYFLVRSSPRLNERLLRSRTFGPMIRDWQRHRGMRRRVKAIAIATMIVVVAATVTLGGLSLPALVTVLVLVLIGVIVILRIPTIRDGQETPLPGIALPGPAAGQLTP